MSYIYAFRSERVKQDKDFEVEYSPSTLEKPRGEGANVDSYTLIFPSIREAILASKQSDEVLYIKGTGIGIRTDCIGGSRSEELDGDEIWISQRRKWTVQ